MTLRYIGLPVLCHQQNCWGHVLAHYPDHYWRWWTSSSSPRIQYWHLGFTDSYSPLGRLCSTDHNLMSLAVQPVFSPPHCLSILSVLLLFAKGMSKESLLYCSTSSPDQSTACLASFLSAYAGLWGWTPAEYSCCPTFIFSRSLHLPMYKAGIPQKDIWNLCGQSSLLDQSQTTGYFYSACCVFPWGYET